MRSFLNELIQQVEVLSMTEILTQILVAAALGFVIYLSYYMSHTGTIYSRKFNTSLVVLAVLTTVVMTAIGNNVALSLGMVGALSIVRFRTAIKDSRDTVYIFWTVVVGLTCGVGDYIMSVVSEYFSRRIDLRVENTTERTVELIYEIPLKIFEKASNRAESIADCLYEIEHVEYVNVVAQDDDISN